MTTEKWEIDRIHFNDATYLPKIPKGWEPFAITQDNNGGWIWIRRRKQ